MSLLFTDSFDHTTTILDKYDLNATSGGGSSTTIGAFGRFGTNGLAIDRGGNGVSYVARFIPATDVVIVGVSIKPVEVPNFIASILQLWEEGNNAHITLTLDGSMDLQVRRGLDNGTLLGTASQKMRINVDTYIELKVTISNTVGTVDLRMNDTNVLSLSGIDTQNGGTANVDSVVLGSRDTGNTFQNYYDDFYILDDAGTKLNDFIGDHGVAALFAAGAGNYTDFLTGDSLPNHMQVDEADPDDDTTHIESATPGDTDSYDFDALTADTVQAVTIWFWSRKTDAGTRELRALARHSSTDDFGATQAQASTYAYYQEIYEDVPGGSNWTPAQVNAAEFGVDVVT